MLLLNTYITYNLKMSRLEREANPQRTSPRSSQLHAGD
jgi:hypothetical protein